MSFESKFVGVCKCGCGERFARGTMINYCKDVEGYVMEGHEQIAHANRENPVCKKCYIAHAGECY